MFIQKDQMKPEIRTEMRGGKGNVELLHILGEDGLNQRGRLFAEITLEPGCSIGYHEHHGESEIFYILQGQGIVSDNGTPVSVKAGDCAICQDGQGHSIENTGNEMLRFMALIIFAGN